MLLMPCLLNIANIFSQSCLLFTLILTYSFIPVFLKLWLVECLQENYAESLLKTEDSALAGVAQWIECQPVNQKVACLGCRPGPQLGEFERQLIDVSLRHQCFSPSLCPSLHL